jgi:hypothetical protein
MRMGWQEVVIGLFGLVVYLLPPAITTVALLKLFALSREVGEVKMLVINLKETIDRANQ